MKYLKLFEDHNSIEKICREYEIENFTIHDGLVNVDDNVYLHEKGLSKIPVKFGEVFGVFSCNNNFLTSLENCPIKVGGDFYCFNNKLTSLENGPIKVGGDFSCGNNKLTSLEHSPKYVGGCYFCYNNRIRDFYGISLGSLNESKGFYCGNNPVSEIYYLFDTIKCVEPLIEYTAIQGNRVVWVRLEEVYYELGRESWIPDPDRLTFKNYELIT